MTRLIYVSVLLFFVNNALAQPFEGKIIYKNVYKSKVPGMTEQQFNDMMGTTQVYMIKGGNYKSTLDGTMMQWQFYRHKDNKLYMKMSTSPAIFWNDGSANPDEVQKAEINKGVETILGHLCDELVLTCKSGVQKYYYNSKFRIDPQSFQQHKFGNFSEVISRIQAVPLKVIIDTPQVVIESIATDVQPGKLDDSEFELPPNSQLQKSPY